jgi:hypothetical protein
MENKIEITKALLKAQKQMGNALKSATNPFFKSKYSDLNSVREAVMPLLNDNGIVVLQLMVTIDGFEYIKTVLMHESGESIESHTKIICKSQNDPQAYGSGVTYARRYGLQSFMSIGADDDDGQKASTAPKPLTDQQKANEKLLHNSKTIDELGKNWKGFDASEQKRTLSLKDELKAKF